MIIEALVISKLLGLKWALKRVSFNVAKSERVLIYGPNGSGKTTLFKIICGLQCPTKGTLKVFGQDIKALPRSFLSKIGLMLTKSFFAEDLTALDNLVFYGRLYGLDKRMLTLRIDELFEWANISTLKYAPVATLSSGQKQRLSMVRCILHNPDLLVLDEPFNALDLEGERLLRNIFDLSSHAHKTIIFSCHNLKLAATLATRVIILKDGKIIQTLNAHDSLLKGCINKAFEYDVEL